MSTLAPEEIVTPAELIEPGEGIPLFIQLEPHQEGNIRSVALFPRIPSRGERLGAINNPIELRASVRALYNGSSTWDEPEGGTAVSTFNPFDHGKQVNLGPREGGTQTDSLKLSIYWRK